MSDYKDKYEIICPTHGQMDIADEKSVSDFFMTHKPDLVVHCAAISDVGRCEREQEFSWNINVVGTENIVKAAKEISAKCVCCSSDQVYFGSVERLAHKEEECLEPANVYGKEKLYAEESCMKIYDKSVHVRLSWMYDAEDKKRMDFIKQMKACLNEGQEVKFSAKDKRGITDVWEVVRNIESALELPGGVYNFGSQNEESTYEMVLDICKELNCDTSCVLEMENANFRNLTMNQEKISRYGIRFSSTKDGVIRNLEKTYTDCIFRLEVEEENERAIHVYEKNGFAVLPYMEMKK